MLDEAAEQFDIGTTAPTNSDVPFDAAEHVAPTEEEKEVCIRLTFAKLNLLISGRNRENQRVLVIPEGNWIRTRVSDICIASGNADVEEPVRCLAQQVDVDHQRQRRCTSA